MRKILIILLLALTYIANAQSNHLSKGDSLHQLALKNQAEDDMINAIYHFTKEAEFYMQNRELNKARDVIDKAVENFPENGDSLFLGYSKILNLRAITFAFQDKPQKTSVAFERQLTHLLAYKSDSSELSKAYRNAAQAYFNMRDSKGFDYIVKAIEINNKLESYEDVIDNYIAIAGYLSNQDLSEIANKYLDQSEALFKLHNVNDYRLLARIYKFKGINYTKSSNYKESFFWVEKAYSTLIDNNIDDRELASTAGNVALEAENLKNYELAKKYAHLTLKHADEYYPPESMMHSHGYLVLGEIYAYQKLNDSADFYLDKCIAIYKKLLGENYSYLSIPYHQKGKVFENKSDILNAALYYQKSIYTNFGMANQFDSNLTHCPNLSNPYFSFDALKYAIEKKSQLLYSHYKETGQVEFLDASINHIHKLDSLEWIFTNRRTMTMEENIIQFKEYEETLNLIAKIASESSNPKYVDKAFQMLNNQKAGFLDANINLRKTTSDTSQLSILKAKLNNLDLDILKAEKILNNSDSLSLKNKTNTLNQICELHLKQIDLKNEINKYESELGETFALENVDIEKVKSFTQQANASILDYFYYKNSLYIFVLNESGLKLKTIEINSDFEDLIISYKRAIKSQSSDRHQIGDKLSDLLLKPVLKDIKDSEKLVIIPFRGLSDIPFDLLPTSESGKLAVNDFAISYNYSTKLWINSFSNEQAKELNLLAIAPVFDNQIKIDLNEFSDFTSDSLENFEFAYRSGIIKPLPFSLAEVSNLQKTFNKKKINNRILIQENASVENFNKYAAESSIIHIATHGTASKSNPYKTGLFFYIPENESADNNFLSVYDLSFIDLKSDLVVLSACKTGSGQLATGEGVIALPRAFINSGASNVLASYWLINDERSKFLMDSFYSHLLNGNDYAKSLQKAKLDCIEKGFNELDWAGFFIVGE